MMYKQTICGKRARFPFFNLKYAEVIIFPQAEMLFE